MIKRASVIKVPDTAVALTHGPSEPKRARVVPKALVEASERAEQVLALAEQRAQQLTRDAERTAAALRSSAADEGRAQGYAEALSRFALVGRLEAEADERALSRSVELARILAERLLGDAIAGDPDAVVGLASRVLSEVRGARQIELHAHPADVSTLSLHLEPALAGLSVVSDPACARGDFRVVTDVGTIEAKLADRLDLLAAKLGEALRKGC